MTIANVEANTLAKMSKLYAAPLYMTSTNCSRLGTPIPQSREPTKKKAPSSKSRAFVLLFIFRKLRRSQAVVLVEVLISGS